MINKYSIAILILVVQVVILCLVQCVASNADDSDEPFKTITFQDRVRQKHIEHAFPAPKLGLPQHALDMFCASVKLRLYWQGYREEAKKTHRKGIYLRRMARFAKHVFSEIRDVDRPFNATMLSRVDKYFQPKLEKNPDDEDFDENADDEEDVYEAKHNSKMNKFKTTIHTTTQRIAQKWSSIQAKNLENAPSEALEEIDSSETVKELNKQGMFAAIQKIKKFAKGWTFKKAALFIYTRWRTMWWMVLSCLYAKYYLWDPALDEFTKLKRSLLMWPELQLIRLQDLSCKPVIFFRRIMDVCKIMNPLMRIDFGTFNYNTLTQFKGQT